MKRHAFSALFVSALGLSATSGLVHAQGVDRSVYTSMAGISGSGTLGEPACIAPIAAFHAIQVWDPDFDSGATATSRRQFLMTCPRAQEATNKHCRPGIRRGIEG